MNRHNREKRTHSENAYKTERPQAAQLFYALVRGGNRPRLKVLMMKLRDAHAAEQESSISAAPGIYFLELLQMTNRERSPRCEEYIDPEFDKAVKQFNALICAGRTERVSIATDINNIVGLSNGSNPFENLRNFPRCILKESCFNIAKWAFVDTVTVSRKRAERHHYSSITYVERQCAGALLRDYVTRHCCLL
jgi:hypothetical protein